MTVRGNLVFVTLQTSVGHITPHAVVGMVVGMVLARTVFREALQHVGFLGLLLVLELVEGLDRLEQPSIPSHRVQ